jgi:hypothetical protein
VGWWRLADLFASHGACFTLSLRARRGALPWLARDAVAARARGVGPWLALADRGRHGRSRRARRSIAATVIAIERGHRPTPVGWHTRSNSTPNTRRLLVENGFLYDSDAYNDDTPYFVDVQGTRHLVLPYAFDTNDMQFQHTQRFATGREFADYVCDAADWLLREGATRPAHVVDRAASAHGGSARAHACRRANPGALATRGGAWLATREQIARHWLAHAG